MAVRTFPVCFMLFLIAIYGGCKCSFITAVGFWQFQMNCATSRGYPTTREYRAIFAESCRGSDELVTYWFAVGLSVFWYEQSVGWPRNPDRLADISA